ncbi:MAG: glycosyltransferase family 39 protein [Solirubrobacterales bacterium]|nr:glycosyltransferase family 39 protein [Solirubrobacterales bacterium]
MSTSDYSARRFGGPVPPWLRDADRARSIPVEVWIAGALVVIAAAIRIAVLTNQSYWMDEALTAYEAQLPLGAMINTVVHVETTPPLYFVLIWVWAHLFGTGEVALRSVSLLAGVALVPIAFLSARDLVGPRAGVVAAALVTFNPFLIWYSQEARAYMLLAALSGASFLWFVRARAQPSRRNLAWWAIWSSLALMTHFFAGFLVAPEALWLLWVARSRVAGGAVACVAVVQVAMLPFALIDTGHGVGWIGQIPRNVRVSQAIAEWGVSIMYRRATLDMGLLGGVCLLALVLALLAFGGDRVTRRGAAVAAAIGCAVWLLPLVLGILDPRADFFLSRNVIAAVVPLAALIAAACVVPRARLLGAALALALVVLFSAAAVQVQTHPYLQRPNWRAVAHALGPATTTRAIVAANGFTADPLKIYLPRASWVQNQSVRVRIGEIDVVGDLKRQALQPQRIVLPKQMPVWITPQGDPVPSIVASPGMRLLARFRVANWLVARFVLDHPTRLSVKQLLAREHQYFIRPPRDNLVFFQRPER